MYTQLKKLTIRATTLAATLTIVTLLFCTQSAFADSFETTDPNFTFNCPSGNVYLVGDFNGNESDDLICFTHNSGGDLAGKVYVALSNSNAESNIYFDSSTLWLTSFCYGEEICQVGDFNGDGKDDIIAFVRSTKLNDGDGDVFVALSNGYGFDPATLWHSSFCYGQEICKVGDFNGDGRDDIVAFVRSTQMSPGEGDVWVALSYGNGFTDPVIWHDSFCLGDEICDVGDFNGDGVTDIISFTRSSNPEKGDGRVWVALSLKFFKFDSASLWNPYFCIGDEICDIGDFNGDGFADIAGFVRSTKADSGIGDVFVSLSYGYLFYPAMVWHDYFCVGNEICKVGDFNGDGADEIILFKFDSGPDSVTVITARVPPPDIHVFTNEGNTGLSWKVTCYATCDLWIKRPYYDYLVAETYDAGVIEGSHLIYSNGQDTTYQLHVENIGRPGASDRYVDVAGNPQNTYVPQQGHTYRFKMIFYGESVSCWYEDFLAIDESSARDLAQNSCTNCSIGYIGVDEFDPITECVPE